MNSYFSIGEYCVTAHQISRFTSNNDAYFFDWLITPSNSMQSIFKSDDAFLSKNWEIIYDTTRYNGTRVLDKGTGLIYQHEFATINGEVVGKIDPSQVELLLGKAKSKFLYLAQKTLQSIRNKNGAVLIRAENSLRTETQAEKRIQEILSIFCAVNPNLKIITASVNCEKEIFNSNYMFIKLEPTEDWTGDNKSWDRLFCEAEFRFKF